MIKKGITRKIGRPLVAFSILLLVVQIGLWMTQGEWRPIRTGDLFSPILQFTALDAVFQFHALRGVRMIAEWVGSTHLYLLSGILGTILWSIRIEQQE